VDVAGRWGIPFHEEDLGLTLGVWGYPMGRISSCRSSVPSTPRDLGAQVAEGFGDPLNNLVTGNPWTPLLDSVRAGRGSPASTNGPATSRRWPISSAPRSTIMRQFARFIGSGERALIRHQEENLPPNPSFSQRDDRGSPGALENSARRPGMISQAANVSEVSKQ